MLSRRPRGKIQSIVMHNTHNANGQWIPTKFDIGSWVMLNPGTSRVCARDARLHGGPTLRGAYKGQIIDWRFKVGHVDRDVTNNPPVESILIIWAYAPRQTRLDPDVVVQRPKCNYVYASYFEDWVDPLSLLGIIVVLHTEIGETQRNGRAHSDLLENAIFYCGDTYVPPTPGQLYHVGRSMLYANFQYGRLRLLGDGITWEHIDQVHNEVMVEVKLDFDDQEIGTIEVGKTWPVHHIREETRIIMGVDTHDDFTLWICHRDQADLKVNRRQEGRMTVGDA